MSRANTVRCTAGLVPKENLWQGLVPYSSSSQATIEVEAKNRCGAEQDCRAVYARPGSSDIVLVFDAKSKIPASITTKGMYWDKAGNTITKSYQ